MGKSTTLSALFISLISCSSMAGSAIAANLRTRTLPTTIDNLQGRIVFQRQTPNQEDSELWIYDLKTKQPPICLNKIWKDNLGANFPTGLKNTTNAHFSPDGKTLVFAGMWNNLPQEWDVFTCNADGSGLRNLTNRNGLRDEDPKFSPDGRRIIYKHNFNEIRLMNLDGTEQTTIDIQPAVKERSMPFFTADGQSVIFVDGVKSEMDIYRCPVSGGTREAVATIDGWQEYYPIAWSGGRILYTRWSNPIDKLDQIYVQEAGQSTALPFSLNLPDAESADPFPLDNRYLFFSSTRQGSGGQDLFIGDSQTGEVWSLQSLNPAVVLDTPQNELAVAYSPVGNPHLAVKVEVPADGTVIAR